jgi:hypothetical protein
MSVRSAPLPGTIRYLVSFACPARCPFSQ